MESSGVDTSTTPLLSALRWIFRPLIKLLIEKGLTFPQLRDMLKAVYVEVADESFALAKAPPSDSRIFILTGVHRKDIKRLRTKNKEPKDNNAAPALSLGGNLVSRWIGTPRFLDSHGKPLCLPRSSPNGMPSFDELVASVTKDVRARVILDEWQRLGIVAMNEDGDVCLRKAAFVPEQSFDEKAHYFGRHIHDHLSSCANNLLGDTEPMLERSVYFSGLTEDSVAKLRSVAETHAVQLLQDINQQALKLQEKDQGNQGATHRMRLGVYWYDKEKSSKP